MVRSVPPWRLMNAAERRRYWFGHWRLAVPALTTLAMVFVMTAPLIVSVPVFPHVALLSVFVWATFQRGLMPPWVAFLVGLVADLLFAMPLGINATLFAMAAGFVRTFESRYGHHAHGFDWGVAAATITVFQLLTWQLMALAGRPVPLPPMLWQVVTSIATYPVIVAVCAAVQRRALGVRVPR
jgi:rod shape-determining protein MreD